MEKSNAVKVQIPLSKKTKKKTFHGSFFLPVTNQILKPKLLNTDLIMRTFQGLLEINSFITIANPQHLRFATLLKFCEYLISFLLDFLRPAFKEFRFNSAIEQYFSAIEKYSN